MLSLDHIRNNGAEHRRQGYRSGISGYYQLKASGFPKGYQTLCYNHQMKKEIARRAYATSLGF